MPPPGSPFPRGQWTKSVGASGALTYHAALWVGDGVAQSLNGGVVTPGALFSDFRGFLSSNYNYPFRGFDTIGGYDTTRRRLLMFPTGGHGGWATWEVNEFDVVSGTWNPDGRPLNPTTQLVRMAPGGSPPTYLSNEFVGGTPDSVSALLDPNHHYDSAAKVEHFSGVRWFPNACHISGNPAAVFMPSVGRFLHLGGYSSDFGINGGGYFAEWDPAARKWEIINQTNAQVGQVGNGWQNGTGVWDPARNVVVLYDGQHFWSYDPVGAYGSRFTMLFDTGCGETNKQGTLALDTQRQRFVYVVQNSTCVGSFYVTNLYTAPVRTAFVLNSGGTDIQPFIGKIPAWMYDAPGDQFLLWFGGKTIYFVHPTSYSVTTTLTPAAGDDPGTREWGAGVPGGYTLLYDAPADVYLTLTDADYAGVSVFAPVRAAPPLLAFTDLATAPRSGNPDAAFGQTANVDGAFVTLWGANLGASQGTSTITVGGVTPRVISWGNATAPAGGAATLFNQYQKLQAIVVQVDHTTPLGAQQIVVTVGGVASAPLPLTITTTGRIRIVGAAAFATALGSAVAEDVIYVQAGTVAGGVGLPSAAIQPLQLAAYPGHAVQIGDATHGGFGIGSGGGVGITYAKFTIYGTTATQAVTLDGNARLVGCLIHAPNGFDSLGAVGMNPFSNTANNIAVLGNEFSQCGVNATDAQYHTLYISGARFQGGPGLNSNVTTAWNYFHDNLAYRAINIFNNASATQDTVWALTGQRVHDNVIVNQTADGIMFGVGVVGENWCYNNLLVNTGTTPVADSGSHVALSLRAQDPHLSTGPVVPSGLPVLLHVYNNTVLHAGSPLAPASGVLELNYTGTLDLHNNIFSQTPGLPYISNVSGSTPAAGQSSRNLWFGSTPTPAFDSTPVTTDPQLLSATAPFDLHLNAASPAIGAGLNMASLGLGLRDLDGAGRPAFGAENWDIGAYQFAAAALPPGAPATLALVFTGLTVDRVGEGIAALAADGVTDAVVTATLTTGDSAPKTIIALTMTCRNPAGTLLGQWDTLHATAYVLGVALTPSGTLLNDPTTMAVNVAVASGGTFVVIASDAASLGIAEFASGNTLTLTSTHADGTTAVGSVVIGAPPVPTLASLNPSAGPPGIQVTLLGTNFSTTPGGNTVRFGTTPATIVSEGATAIIALVPLLPAGTYRVTVETAGGVSNFLDFQEVPVLVGAGSVPIVRTRFRRWS